MVKATNRSKVVAGWKKAKVEEVFCFLRNNTLSRENLNDGKGHFQNIHYGDILIRYGAILDCSTDKVPYVNEEVSVKSINCPLKNGDIIMADTAEDETVGKSIEIENIEGRNILSGLHTIPMRPKKTLFAPRYLGYYLNSWEYHNQILPFITGIKVSSISRSAVKGTYVHFPADPNEQKDIADALSDIDRLITATEKLIAKRKAVKRGLMQELLTGKRRLKSFNEETSTRSIGDLKYIKISKGGVLSSGDYKNGKIPVVAGGKEPAGYHNIPNRSANTITISASGAGAGFVNFWEEPIFATDCSTISESRHYSVQYLYYSLALKQEEIYKAQTGGAQPHVHPKDLANIRIWIPSLPEQEEIAKILFTADKEIKKLINKLQKLKNIKSGMMSELLSGRIRLLAISPNPGSQGGGVARTAANTRGHNAQFDDAVMISAIVNAFYSPQYPLGRKKIQKLLYLARRHQKASIEGFLKKAAGPYKPSARYSGGEKIAVSSRYISETRSDKGSVFAPGEKIQAALDYAAQWDLVSTVDWLLQNFKYTSVNNLEVLATVDMAICDLKKTGATISIEAVKNVLRDDSEWMDKLVKSYFSDKNISHKIKLTQKLWR